jgi:hypothetical protein
MILCSISPALSQEESPDSPSRAMTPQVFPQAIILKEREMKKGHKFILPMEMRLNCVATKEKELVLDIYSLLLFPSKLIPLFSM